MHHVRTKMPGVTIGTIARIDQQGRTLVQFDGSDGFGVPAKVAWLQDPPNGALSSGCSVILGFENGDDTLPVVLGLLENLPKECVESNSEKKPDVIHLRSEKELILECGDAKIKLRADGRITILGGYVVSRSSGVNKIKGGSVQIN